MLPADGGVVVAVLVLGLVGAAGDLDCASPVEAWDELGRCPRGRVEACRGATTHRFEALWEARRVHIEAKHRRMLDDDETRCRATIGRRGGRFHAGRP